MLPILSWEINEDSAVDHPLSKSYHLLLLPTVIQKFTLFNRGKRLKSSNRMSNK